MVFSLLSLMVSLSFSLSTFADEPCTTNIPSSSSSDENLLILASGGQPRNALANRKVFCIENQTPTKGPFYKDEMAVLAKALPPKDPVFRGAWTYVKATDFEREKIKAIYEASVKYNMPQTILYGALIQESSMQEMGLSKDFFNWACGMAQLNLNDWCEWANHSGPDIQKKIGWPKSDIDALAKHHPKENLCGTFFIVPEYVRPFYEAGMKKLHEERPDAPEYMLESRHVNTPDAPVFNDDTEYKLFRYTRRYFPATAGALTTDQLKVRFEMARSFAMHCSDHNFGIPAGAYTFKLAFDALPEEIKNAQRYKPGEAHKPDNCMAKSGSDYFPLSVGWLLADAIYNAGPELLPGVLAYQKKSQIPWDNFSPENLIDAINYSLSLHNLGMSKIGEAEARIHVRGVLNNVAPK